MAKTDPVGVKSLLSLYIYTVEIGQVNDSSLDWVEPCLYYHDYSNVWILANGYNNVGFRSHCNSRNEIAEEH